MRLNRDNITGIAVVALAAILIFGTMSYYAGSNRQPHIDIDRSRYPLKGIDVSQHNGEIDFGRVAADTVSFVYIKASEGSGWRDPRFRHNFANARAAGLRTGAYHFFRFDVSGLAQAHNFIESLGGCEPDLPLAIDLEEWKNSPDVTTGDVIDRLGVMVDRLKAEGYNVVIYTNKSGYSRFLHSRFDDLGLWLCSFTDPPVAGEWQLWQHSHIGEVDGVSGKVDINTFNGTESEFDKFAQLKKKR